VLVVKVQNEEERPSPTASVPCQRLRQPRPRDAVYGEHVEIELCARHRIEQIDERYRVFHVLIHMPTRPRYSGEAPLLCALPCAAVIIWLKRDGAPRFFRADAFAPQAEDGTE